MPFNLWLLTGILHAANGVVPILCFAAVLLISILCAVLLALLLLLLLHTLL